MSIEASSVLCGDIAAAPGGIREEGTGIFNLQARQILTRKLGRGSPALSSVMRDKIAKQFCTGTTKQSRTVSAEEYWIGALRSQ
ncbi:hypothetical protein ACVIIW_000761 [Bradyrhizobium sp. USDA 4449]